MPCGGAGVRVLIVDAYYRGASLACELRQKGLEVYYVDLSHMFGPWLPEDWEGPFGFFDSDSLLPEQSKILKKSFPVEVQKQGFVIHADGYPLEFKGPLFDHHLQTKLDAGLIKFFKENEKKYDFIDIKKSWPAMVGVSAMSNISEPQMTDSMPILADYFIRRPHRSDYENIINQIRGVGVKIIETKDFINSLNQDFLESYDKIVTTVSSINFKSIFAQNTDDNLGGVEISPHKFLQVKSLFFEIKSPDWYWSRYSFLFDTVSSFAEFPANMIYVPVLNEPWFETNFLVLQKSSYKNWWDIWLRLPYLNLKDSMFYEMYRDKIIKILAEFIPRLRLVEYRLPTCLNPEVRGLPFPIFSKSEKLRNNQKIIDFSEETLPSFDWASRFAHERSLIDLLINQAEKIKKVK